MSAKHQTPEYRRNAAVVRRRVQADHRRGRNALCWRCRGPIRLGDAFDVGHLPGAVRSRLEELAPEHRHAVGQCPGNRADGGRQGAALTNARRAPNVVPSGTTTTWPI